MAVVSGNGLVILNGLAGTRGEARLFGNGANGATRERLCQCRNRQPDRQRPRQVAGIDRLNLSLTRTYNSLGDLSTVNGLN